MAAKRKSATNADVVELLEKQLIVSLSLAGVPQRSIREVVECDLNRVTRIVKRLKRRNVKGGS
jgi:hypothetical protein